MKKQIRILAIDDSPFSFSDKYCRIIGVVMRGGEYLECVLSGQVMIDGDEATSVCEELIKSTKHNKQIRLVMIDGIALGGFNIININYLYDLTNIPIVTITRDCPNLEKIKIALKKNFKDWKKRWDILNRGELYEIKTKHNPIYIKCAGIDLKDAKEIIDISTIRGVLPEPLRIAHIIASGVTRGESYGKA